MTESKTSTVDRYDHRSSTALARLRETRSTAIAIPELDDLEERRASGDPVRAAFGLRQIIKALDADDEIDDIHRWLRVRTQRQLTECLIDQKQTSDLSPMLSQFVKQIRSEKWTAWQTQVGEQYARLIGLNVNLEKFSEALDVYAECHEFIQLDDVVRYQLATAAAGLHRKDDGAIELYLAYLETLDRVDDVQRHNILAATREALRVDFEEPSDDRLELVVQHNERLYNAAPLSWAKAHCAMALERLERREEALTALEQCAPLDEADADVLLLLGVVCCCVEEWIRAKDMFQRASDRGAPNEKTAYYSALASMHHTLLHPEEYDDTATYQAALAEELRVLSTCPPAGGPALDGVWVQLQAAVAVGNTEVVNAQIRAVAAGCGLPKWRQVAAWVQALWVRGEIQPLREWIDQTEPADRPRMFIARAAEAMWYLFDNDAHAAREAVQAAVQLSADEKIAAFDSDFAPGAALLNEELFLADESLDTGQPGAVEVQPETTPAVAAHHRRVAAWRAIAVGDFDRAIQEMSDRCHDAGPHWLVDRVTAVAHAYAGRVEEMEAALQRLLDQHGDRPAIQLAAGLWHHAQQRPAEAIKVLEPIMQSCAAGLDAAIVLGDAMLAVDRTDEARRVLGHATALVVNGNPPRPLLYRPWRLRIDPHEWSQGPRLGMLADVCHLAELCLRADLHEDAAAVLRKAERFIVREVQSAREWLGKTLEATALRFVLLRRFDIACDLRRRAEQYIGIDKLFAESLADVIREQAAAEPDRPVQLSDSVIEHFIAYTDVFDGQPADFAASGPGGLLMAGLKIDDDSPATEAETRRCIEWTKRLAEAYGGWAWPHRNLARACLRANDPGGCISHLDVIPRDAVRGEDHWLKGQALFTQEQFPAAATAFDAAIADRFQEGASAGMRGVCRTLDGWINRPGGPVDVDALLADLDVEALARAEIPDELRERAIVFRIGILLVADRVEDAAVLLEQFELKTQPVGLVAALRGLIEIRTSHMSQAIARWERACKDLPKNDDLHMLLFWAELGRPGYAALQRLDGNALALHRAGRRDRQFHVLNCRLALRAGNRTGAKARLQAAREAGPKWQHAALALLNDQVQREFTFTEARWHLATGKPKRAREELAGLGGVWFSQSRVRFHDGLAAAHAKAPEDSARTLEPLGEAGDVDAAALLGRLAASRGDAAKAGAWIDVALRTEPDHPLALLVKAELAQADGDADAARQAWKKVAGGGRYIACELRACAHLALGRLAEEADQIDEAERHYRAAIAADPDHSIAAGRLICLAARMEVETDLAVAAAKFFRATPPALRSLRGFFAVALLARQVNELEALAEALGALVGHPDCPALAPAQQSAIARWSAHAQISLERFGEASEAIKSLLTHDDSPELRTLLIDCRMLEAAQLLRQHCDGVDNLERIVRAAEDVLRQQPNHPIALLLAATAKILSGQLGEEHAALVGLLCDQEWDSPRLRLLAELNRMFVDASSAERMGQLIEELDLDPQERQYLQILGANLARDAGQLAKRGEQALREGMEQSASLPVSPAHLAGFIARRILANAQATRGAGKSGAAGKQIERAESLLRLLHDAEQGNAESVWLHAFALVQVGIALITEQKVFGGRDRLKEARLTLQAAIDGPTEAPHSSGIDGAGRQKPKPETKGAA